MPSTFEFTYTTGSDPDNAWSSDAGAFDGATGSPAVATVGSGATNWSTKYILASANSIPSTFNALPIREVYLVALAQQPSTVDCKLAIVPVYNGTSDGDVYVKSMTYRTATYFYNHWTSNLVGANGAPSTWTWDDIRNLDVKVYPISTLAVSGSYKLDKIYVSVVFGTTQMLNVTYPISTQNIQEDDFEDGSLDSTKWTVSTSNGCDITESSGKLHFTYPNVISAGDIKQYTPDGNFDFYVTVSEYTTKTKLAINTWSNGSTFYNIGNPETNLYYFYSSEFSEYDIYLGQASTASGYSSAYIEVYDYTTLNNNTSEETHLYTYPATSLFPAYIRIRRINSSFELYRSTNASTWELVHSGVNAHTYGRTQIKITANTSATGKVLSIDEVKTLPIEPCVAKQNIRIYDASSVLTKYLPIAVNSGYTGYLRLEKTSAYTGDIDSKLRVSIDGTVYSVCRMDD